MSLEERFIWLNGEIVHLNDAKISVLSPTAQFGANVFEGIRCYWNKEYEKLYAFRLYEHYHRLKESIKIFKINSKYTEEELLYALTEVIKKNNYKEDIAVRQTVFIDGFGTWSSKEPVGMFIAPVPKPRVVYTDDTGLRCGISSWQRISDKNLSPRVKSGANYINSRMAQLEAIEHGYDSAIFLNEQGKVSEGPGSCLFIYKNNKFITPPLTSSVLDSITRNTLIRLIPEELGMEVEERDIDRTELYVADEVFLCGSAMEIMPVKSIDGYVIGTGKYGSYTKNLHDIYLDITTGKLCKYSMWIKEI